MLRVSDSFKDSDTGRQRRANEDSLYASAPLFAVADGMGGAQAGEVASRIAVEAFAPGLPDGPQSAEERLAALVQRANGQVYERSRADADLAGMGTTLTAAYVGEEEVSIAHVGDSRLYLLRDERFERLTRDHSLVDELVREGRLTPEEADVHPQRSIITRALGAEATVEVDRLTSRGRAGDVYLICSDGLTSMVPESQVGEIVAAAPSLSAAGRSLIKAANDAGGRDNITVVLFRLEEVAFADAGDAAQATRITMAPSAEELRAAAPAAPVSSETPGPAGPEAAAVQQRAPRLPPTSGKRERPRGPLRKSLRGLTWLLIVLFPFAAGGYIATQAVYFVGTDDEGFVSVFKGVPYELPGGARLYSENFVSGVSVRTLPPRDRKTVTAHKLRSLRDANDLVRQIERGELDGQARRPASQRRAL